MKTRILISALLTATLSMAAHSTRADGGKKAVLFVLDISNSMHGEPLAQVKQTLNQVASSVSPDMGLGLISFWGCGEGNVVLNYPVEAGASQHQSLVVAANAMETKHHTDIYTALVKAEEEVKRKGGEWCVNVILLSDGNDHCHEGNWQAIAARIVGVNQACNKINVVTFGAGDWQAEILKKVAEAGKGQFKAAESVEQAQEEVKEMVAEMASAEKKVQWASGSEAPKAKPKAGQASGTDPEAPAIEDPTPIAPAPLESQKQKSEGNGSSN